MATLGAAAGQNLAAIGGLHALAEAVNRFTATLMRLECTFHDAFVFLVLNADREKRSKPQIMARVTTPATL
jgi:hypothetical protein